MNPSCNKAMSNTPRYLTSQEIEDIVSSIPQIYGADGFRAANSLDTYSGKVARNSIQDFYRKQLRFYQITPDGIEDVKREFAKKFQRAFVEGGEPIGFLAEQAISEPTTQMTLNTFHTAGSGSSVTAGFNRLEEITQAQTTKSPMMTLVFKDRVSLSQVLEEKRRNIVGLMISDIVADYDIIYGGNHKYEHWYSFYNLFVDRAPRSSSYFLRLSVDLQQMYTYRITMEDVANSIRQASSQGEIHVVPSTFVEAKIDIHVRQDEEDETTDQENLTFFKLTILPILDKNQIVQKNDVPRGISGVRSVSPVQTNIWNYIGQEEYRGNNIWDCHYNQEAMFTTGVDSDRLAELARKSGMKVAKQPAHERAEFLRVLVPHDSPYFVQGGELLPESKRKPSVLINAILDKKREEREEKRQKQQKDVFIPPDEYTSLATLVTAEAACRPRGRSNLRDTLALDDIDAEHSFTNDIHEMLELFGIEATRNLIIQQIADIIANTGGGINIRHIALIADYMTGRGVLIPFTYYGMSKRGFGPLTVASFERAQEEFNAAAAMGSQEKVSSGTPSSSLYFANKGLYGTGYFDVITSEDIEKGKKQTESSSKKVSASSISSALQQNKPQAPLKKPPAPKKIGNRAQTLRPIQSSKPTSTTVRSDEPPSSQSSLRDSVFSETSVSTVTKQPGEQLKEVGKNVSSSTLTCVGQKTEPKRSVSTVGKGQASAMSTTKSSILPITPITPLEFVRKRFQM
jgi:hypothetical protein